MERLLVLLCLIGASTMVNAEIFKWIDAQGSVHYGDKPMEHSETVVVDTGKKGHINTGSSREEKRQKLLNAMQQDKTRNEQEEKKNKEIKQRHERNCVLYKDRLKQIERASYLYDIDAEGKRVIASNEERDKKTQQLRGDIQKNCK